MLGAQTIMTRRTPGFAYRYPILSVGMSGVQQRAPAFKLYLHHISTFPHTLIQTRDVDRVRLIPSELDRC